MRTKFAAAALALLLAGCAASDPNQVLIPLPNPWAKFAPTDSEIIASTWAPRAAAAQPQPARFCYRTLARADCYTEPRPGQEGRLVADNGLGGR